MRFLYNHSSTVLCVMHLSYRQFANPLLSCVFLISTLLLVQGNVDVCNNVFPPVQGGDPENCSLVCSLKFQHAVSSIQSDEVTLCIKNTSVAVFCTSQNDCRQYHVGSYCKLIPCLCKAKLGPPESYIFDSSFKIPKLNACVVSAKYINPDMPLVPFPWKTLLIVSAIVFVFAACLICLRWVSPLIRSMQAKRATRGNRDRQMTAPEDNTSLFPPVPQQTDSTPFTYYFPQGVPRIYRANPRRPNPSHRASSRVRYATCAQNEGDLSSILANQDKPPPYETAVQLPPPAYEDVQNAINESRFTCSTEIDNQRVQVHITAENQVSAPANPSPASQ